MARKPKPALSEWLIAHRKDAGETVADIARVTDRSEATVRGWEAGRPPQADDPVIAHLERHWGSVAPTEAGPDQSALVAALDRQTILLATILDQLVSDGADREARLRAVEAELESLRGPQAGEASPMPPVPDGTKG
jgi:hypothetical protein